MARRRSVVLSVQADIRDLQAELAKMPGISEKEAKKMVRSLNRQLQKAEKEAKRTAAASKQAWGDFLKVASGAILGAGVAVGKFGQEVADLRNELTDMSTRTGIAADTLAGLRLAAEGSGQDFSGLSRVLTKLPVVLGDVERETKRTVDAFAALEVETHETSGELREGDAIFRDVIGSLSEMEGKTGKAAAAADLFGASGTKLLQAFAGAGPLDDFVTLATEFGVGVGPDAAKAAGDWQRSMAELDNSLDGAKARLIDTLDVAGLVDGFTLGFVFMGQFVATTFNEIIERAGLVAGALSAMLSGDFSSALDIFSLGIVGMGDALGTARDAALDEAQAFWTARQAVRDATGAVTVHTAATRDGTDATVAATAALDTLSEVEAARQANQAAILTAEGELAALIAASRATQLSAEDLVFEAYVQRLAVIDELAQATGDAAGADEARAASQIEFQAELAEVEAARREAERREAERLEAYEESVAAKRRARANDALNSSAQLASGMSAAFGVAADRAAETNIQAAKRLFAAQKAAGISEAVIQGAVAVMTALAQLGPVAGAVAAIGIGLTTAATVAVIAAEQPAFDIGGVVRASGGVMARTPDQITARVLPGEAVLSRSATERIGPQGVAAMNRGDPPAPQVIPMPVYEHFNRFARDSVRARGPLRRELRKGRSIGILGY